MFGPWLQGPGLIPGTVRDIQPSAIQAGLLARNDAAGISPNQAAGGDQGITRYANAVKSSFPIEQDRSDLNDGSFNLFILKNGQVKSYGARTLVSQVANPHWFQYPNRRLYMAISAKADEILDGYVLRMIDGQRVIFKDCQGELEDMLGPYWKEGALYGASAEEAYKVDTGGTVNTDTPNGGTIAKAEIHAVIELTMSSTGETVILDIVKKRIGG
jgi:hypothetical protein